MSPETKVKLIKLQTNKHAQAHTRVKVLNDITLSLKVGFSLVMKTMESHMDAYLVFLAVLFAPGLSESILFFAIFSHPLSHTGVCSIFSKQELYLPFVQSIPPTAYTTPTVDFLGLVRGLCRDSRRSGRRWYLSASMISSWQSRSSLNNTFVSTWSAINYKEKIKLMSKTY